MGNMRGMNCWEYKKCRREQGGEKSSELGVCPAFSDESSNNLNSGQNGGRICWAVSGTFCGGKVQGSFAQKEFSCLSCDFFNKVKEEEGTKSFLMLKPGQKYKRVER